MLACFLFCFHCSASSSHSPASCRISLAQVGLGLAISQGGPLCCGLPLSARPGPPGPLGAVLSQAGSPLRGRGPRRARAFGRSAPLQPAGDGASSRGRSNQLSGAPGGCFQSAFFRRPSQGLRFSRQTRRRAPEAGITGGDNSGASETWARLLVLKIAPAVFRGGLAPRSPGVVAAASSGRPASPRVPSSPGASERAGRGSFVPERLWLGARAPG